MTDPSQSDRTALAAAGVAAVAVACCAGGPLLVAFAGSLAVGALIGIAAALALLFAACGALYLRHRPSAKRPRSKP